MVGRVIRALGTRIYVHPKVEEDAAKGEFARLKVAVVSDYFTADCLSQECRIRVLTPSNYREVIDSWKPDLVFAESVFHGVGGVWRYELAKQPRWMRLTRATAIFRLVEHARSRGIPALFWNKDDGAFFDTFIDVARAFDYVFTTDQECVERYQRVVPDHVPVHVLQMPYQPAFHSFDGFEFSSHEACFTGSYYSRILEDRRRFLNMMFDACAEAAMPLNVFDRNHHRLSRRFEFGFPTHSHLVMHQSVSHRLTASVYKAFVASVNVNSIMSSSTMYSRRLLEILACGGIVVTNASMAVNRHFKEYCHVVETREQAVEVLARLRNGPSVEDKERAAAGAAYVRDNHTWAHRLYQVADLVNL